MFTAMFTVATLALAAFAQDVSINTPKSVTQCKEIAITWQGGKGPYTVSVVPGDNPCDEALIELPATNDTWFHWQNPQMNPGTKVIFAIEDGSGDEAWSNEVTIQKGTTSSCETVSSSSTAAGSTLVVPAQVTSTVAPLPTVSDSQGPVQNPADPGAALGAAPSGTKGSYMAAGAGLVVALASAVFAL